MESNKIKTSMNSIAQNLMTVIQMGLSYKGWSPEFSYKEIKEKHENNKEQMKEIIGDFFKLSIEELQLLGFTQWSEETPDLWLIPLWCYDLIPDGTELTDINNNKYIKGRDEIDLDIRFGCMAYGILIKSV